MLNTIKLARISHVKRNIFLRVDSFITLVYYIKMNKPTPSRRFIKRLFCSKLFLFSISLILIALIVNAGKESYRKHQLKKEIDSLNVSIEQLEGNNRQLGNLMEHLKQESYLEKEARLRLNVKKPGEQVVILSSDLIYDSSVQKEVLAYPESLDPKETAIYWKWWEYFFSN